MALSSDSQPYIRRNASRPLSVSLLQWRGLESSSLSEPCDYKILIVGGRSLEERINEQAHG